MWMLCGIVRESRDERGTQTGAPRPAENGSEHKHSLRGFANNRSGVPERRHGPCWERGVIPLPQRFRVQEAVRDCWQSDNALLDIVSPTDETRSRTPCPRIPSQRICRAMLALPNPAVWPSRTIDQYYPQWRDRVPPVLIRWRMY